MSLKPDEFSDEPNPIGWFDLPFEMREMVIDRMENRCRFAQCSRLCEKEVKQSKHYLTGIGIERFKSGEIRLLVYIKYIYPCNYHFKFTNAGDDQTTVEYRSKCIDADWRAENNTEILKWTKLESGKPNDVRIRYFKEYIEKYKRSIRLFLFVDDIDPIHQFSIKELRNLRYLHVERVRSDCPGLIESGFIDWDQMLRLVLLEVKCSNTSFTFENIINFTGQMAVIRSNSLNQAQVNEYLKMRKKGEIHQKLKIIHVETEEHFDVPFIMRGLDVFDYSEKGELSRFPNKKYEFKFRSDVNKNGVFCVSYLPSSVFLVYWKGSNI